MTSWSTSRIRSRSASRLVYVGVVGVVGVTVTGGQCCWPDRVGEGHGICMECTNGRWRYTLLDLTLLLCLSLGALVRAAQRTGNGHDSDCFAWKRMGCSHILEQYDGCDNPFETYVRRSCELGYIHHREQRTVESEGRRATSMEAARSKVPSMPLRELTIDASTVDLRHF